MQIFKTKWVVGFSRRERILDATLCAAISRVESGLVDADLGGGIVKIRVARAGQGRSGGYRMLIAYRAGARAVFLYGFAKAERGNITADELLTLREIGAGWLAADMRQTGHAVEAGVLQEVSDGPG